MLLKVKQKLIVNPQRKAALQTVDKLSLSKHRLNCSFDWTANTTAILLEGN